MQNQGPAQKRYATLSTDRDPYLDRARDCSLFTIPALIPPSDWSATSKLYQPYQSLGARGVNNLASKLLLALFPLNAPCFRLKVNSFTAKKMSSDPEFKTKIEQGLGEIERATMDEIETKGDRVSLFESLKHLIVGGNVLLNIPADDALRVYHLDSYVCKRDASGTPLEMVTVDKVAIMTLPEEVQAQLRQGQPAEDSARDMTDVEVYTHIRLDGDMYKTYQEVCGIEIPGSRGSHPKDKPAYIPLRFIKIDGEDYGRSYVEEYFGDLKSLEALSEAMVEAAAAAAKVLFLVKPGGSTNAKTIAEAPNGAVRPGNAEDVTVLQMQKFNDFRVALDQANAIEERLSRAFLLNSAIQRDAERVTAEEIRYMAQELESALGGIYSIMSQELQVPFINRRMALMQKADKLPKLPKDVVSISIVTGMESLGRGQDRNKLVAFISTLGQALGPETIMKYVNLSDFISRLATSDGIDTNGLIKTEEEIAQAEQQQQQMAAMQSLGPNAIKAASDVVKGAMQQQPQGTNG